tara:strand:- start:684 stop:2861 length:2178 start_codon:yes stop_codon:yes gene_type:complete
MLCWQEPSRSPFPGTWFLGLFLLFGCLDIGGSTESLKAVKIASENAPVIDGDLSDSVWDSAALIPNLTQMYPNEQQAPSEQTEIRVCFDSHQFYVAFRCLDKSPDEINASIMQRDQSVGADDYVFILLDPFQTGRDGYYFRLNANGAKGEGRITSFKNGPNMNWDAIWDGAGRRTDEGWAVEFAIPFRSISFDPNSQTWGANFGRWLPRVQERDRWSGAYRSRNFLKLEDEGTITGISEVEQGLGVDLKPYLLGRHQSGNRGDGFKNEYGADLFWQITPNLTTTLTWNTDFAEAEVDDRVVNLTRFPLFFPEKRDFFLEGQEYFEFGPASSSLTPFHSRTIGLSQAREKVDINGGGKLTGRIGKLGVGVMGAFLNDAPGLEKDRVGVMRLTYDVGKESRVGTFFSYGDPRRDGENVVGGVDFDFKASHLGDGQDQLNIKLYELMSRDDAGIEAHAFGVDVRYPNEPFSFNFGLRQIDDAFTPGQGFVRRPGTRRGTFSAQQEFYPEGISWLREYSIETSGFMIANLENQTESAEFVPLEFAVDFESGDEFVIFPEWRREQLFEPFDITDDVTIPVGGYDFTRLVAGFETSSHRPVSMELYGKLGEFYDGTRHGVSSELEWRPSPYWGLEAEVDFDMIDLPQGEFEVLVGQVGVRITPNPRLSWNTLVQWDSVSNNVGLNSRLRYIVSPGNDIFLVFNQGYLFSTDREFVVEGTEAAAKVGWTFRF